ncbi:uncharacterized protein (TIGR03086 family) [Saccharothrix tamanrassetensis]|uniref:Uncharacterized protein (TIGR03086 family) n=1 Tax=Saccharothrix tamanrassetensis TaxID=1051531 RepID=A0A841CSD2_9PSEU|nr:TIGR03086 family metal-binding protein [Saccharothrix tamanrassetensis]MBB5958947.1 uncharacterized protein (TIGR03086 family) [Saccharothrix tamanrassetensis]
MDLLDLNRAAIDANIVLTGKLTPGDFDLVTPCTGWTVRDLLQHQVDMSLKFDAGARGGEVRAQADQDLVAAYAVASDQVTESFRANGFLDREAEFPGFGTRPGSNLVAAHFVDNLVHSWDLRRALGLDGTLDDELALAAYKMARRYPSTPDVRGPGAAFGLPVDVAEDASITDRLVGLLGRSPDWSA